MTSPRSCYATCAGHEIHYMDWGDPQAPVVIAWHGLARTGRDMDPLAAHLSAGAAGRWRVICPDTLGRGLSQWATRPDEQYCLEFYARIAAELFDRLDIGAAHWVGTSMGGAIGTVCAAGLAQPQLAGRIRSLLLNDNAPELAQAALSRIRAYAGQPPAFATMAELQAYFRQVYAPYGWLGDAQWCQLTETSARRLPDGRLAPHYDPAMVRQFTARQEDDYLIWQHYDALDLPVLLLRGEQSDLVLPQVVDEMRTRGPGARGQLQVVQVPGCGHAPALNVPRQWALVDDFLAQDYQKS